MADIDEKDLWRNARAYRNSGVIECEVDNLPSVRRPFITMLSQDRQRLMWVRERSPVDEESPEFRGPVPGTRMLERFIELAEANTDAILKYAEEWGPLGICSCGAFVDHDHIVESARRTLGEPAHRENTRLIHDHTNVEREPGRPEEGCVPERCSAHLGSHVGTLEEPLERWRSLAREVRAVLNLRAALHKKGRGSRDDWVAIMPSGVERLWHFLRQDRTRRLLPQDRTPSIEVEHYTIFFLVVGGTFEDALDRSSTCKKFPTKRVKSVPWLELIEEDPDRAWEAITAHIHGWLKRAPINYTCTYNRKTGTIQSGLQPTEFLFGLIVQQVLMLITGTESLVTCDACGSFYLPHRKPRPDHNHFCETCGKKAADRVRKRAKAEAARAPKVARKKRAAT